METYLKLGLVFTSNYKSKGEERERVIRFNCNVFADIFLDQLIKLSFLSSLSQPIKEFFK